MGKLRKFKRRTRIFLQRKVDRRYYVFAICLICSAFIWMMMQLSQSSVTTIDYPVEYTSLPEAFVLTDTSVSEVTVNIRSVGFGILAEKYFSKTNPIKINLEETSPSGRGDKRYVLSRNLRSQLEDKLGQNREIVSISPDTLWMDVSKRVEKSVKVNVKADIQPAERFFLSTGPTAIPDSVMVEGPEQILDTLSSIFTAAVTLPNVKKSDTVFIEIKPQDPLLRSLQSEVKVAFSIDELTERKLMIPIKVFDPPANAVIHTFPDSVEVSFTVGLKEYDKISATDFVARLANLKDVDLEEVRKLEVKIDRLPEGITNVSYSPDRVAFVLEQKEE